MYALSVSAEGDCYRCVPPDPGIADAALGASESGTLPGTAPAEALHTFMLDSGASRCFFCDSTNLTPLPAPILVRLADPSEGPVVARSSTVLRCPAVPFGSLSGLHLPSFSTNLTLLWHRRLGQPSLPRLRGMHSRLFVSGLPRSLPPLPPSPALPWLPCVEGQQRAAPHSSSLPPTTASLQTLHMDVWDPARVSGQSRERYFLLVVDDYMRYTTVFPLRSKGQVVDVLIPWIRKGCLHLRERFGQDLLVLRLHSDRGGDFSSDLLRDFCRGEGILQSFTLPDSPQQNGIAERHIGLVMEVARTSMIHAASPHFLWPFVVRYAAHQLNLWPRVSLPETSPTLRWIGEVGDASVFRFYHPTLHHDVPSQDVTFDESVPFYRLFPYRSAPPPPPPLFLAPGPPLVDPLPPQGPAPSSVSQIDPLSGPAPVQVVVGSGAEPGDAESEGAETGDAEPGGVVIGGGEPGGIEPEGVEPGGAASEGAESGGAEPQVAASSGGSAGASPRMSPQQLREWFVRRARVGSGASGAGVAGAAGAGGTGVAAGAGVPGGTVAAGSGGARTRGTGAAGNGGVEGAGAGDLTESGTTGAGGAGAGEAGVGGTGTGGTGVVDPGVGDAGTGGAGAVYPDGTVLPQSYFVPLLQQVLGTTSSSSLTPPLLCPLPDQSQPPLQPASSMPAPSPYPEKCGSLTDRREPASRPVLPVRTARRVPSSRPPPVPGTHAMTLRPSSVPLHVPLPAPPESSLPAVPDPECDHARAASPAVSHLLTTATTALVAESASADLPTVGGESALGTDVFEDRQEDFECLAAAVPRLTFMLLAPEGDPDAPDIPTPRSNAEAITGPYSSQWQAAMDADMASWKFIGTYVDEVTPPGANIVDGMWIFRVKWSPGSPPAFKARYVARGFSQRQRVDYFQTFSPTPKMTTLRVLLHVAAQHDYDLRRPVHGLRQAPREWYDTLRTTLAALGFAPATADPSLFLRSDTSLPPFCVLVYIDDLVFATADTEALTLVTSELQKRHTYTDLGEVRSYLGLQITRDRARRNITLTQSHMVHQVLQPFFFQFSSPQPTPLSTWHWLSAPPSDESVEPSGPYPELVGCLISSSEAEIYAGAMAAQELRWLTYLLSDLGEHPRSPPQRCQLRLAYEATRANTADIFTKALPPGDHQRFSTVLGLLALLFLTGLGVVFVKPAAPVVRETVAPIAREPVAPVARESVAPAARLAAEPVTPVAHLPVAPFASVPVAPVARVPAASAATHHLLSSHGPSSSSLALSFLRCAWCTTSGGVLLLVPAANSLGGRRSRVRIPVCALRASKCGGVSEGVEFFQTFSPTPKITTLRVLLHVAAQRDYELHSLDFSAAFLQGSLHEEICLRRPPGFTGSFPAGTQWSLRRPVYGLRQAPREWHDTLKTTLAALGFAPSTSDPFLFLHTDTTLPTFYVLVYVDDLVFATADTEALAHVKSELQKRHTCTDLGEITSYLGLRITRDRAQRTITLTQSHMVQQVLQRFGFTYSSPQSSPLPTGHSLSAPPSDESVEPSGPYPELVGCLMHLMTCTRPDLAYPLSLLAHYVAPGRDQKVHWDAAKRVLRYLCSTSGMGLVLGGWAQVVLTDHADASLVDDLATQRSSQGYTFSLGSGSVSWRSTRSSSVLSSSFEAEIFTGAMAAHELRWLTYLVTDLGEAPRSPPVLYVDNKAMLALCQEHRLEHRMKHIALCYFLA
ncbi:unnamed protein product [Closterium sp. NIES-53]